MKVGIVGAGAIGLLTAKLLEDFGHQVLVLQRTKKEVPMLFQTPSGDLEMVSFSVTDNWEDVESVELLIVATKAYHLPAVLPQLRTYPGPLLFIQNGLVSNLVAKKLKETANVFGSVDHGATIQDGILMHTGHGSIRFGGEEKFAYLATELGPVLKWESHIEHVLLRKAALNTLINPLTALLDVRNGTLSENKALQRAVISHYDELILGIPVLEELLSLEDVFDLIKRTSTNTSSMRNDVLRGEETEVDYIVKPLLEIAEKEGRYLPITGYLYELIQSKRGEYDRKYT
ncbi:ketopantoate reductase family protein [Chryseomicrobium palamuruense]|uniref:2-dehydropantoate 2-reductase n=1 Tax=Chryseomicrobium palamuruense TaxID=682973 RepID=A0ABV8UUW0_9BACL